MSIKQIQPNLWLIDVQVWKDGKDYRKRERVQGGKKTLNPVYGRSVRNFKTAEESTSSLKLTTFKNVLNYYLRDRALIHDHSAILSVLKPTLEMSS